MTTVTQFIKDNLKARIQSDGPLPYRLTLADISRYYGVSLMPVRQAVKDLVAEEVISQKDNGRLVVKNKPYASTLSQVASEVDLQGPKSELAQAINNEVVVRSLVHNTEYLREEATASKHGVGRTTVRQIFTRLSGEGIMEHVPRCGWRVKPYKEEDMLAYLDVRELLELKALTLAYKSLDKQQLRALLEKNKPAPGESVARLDNTLHAFWIDQCENYYIIEFFKRYGQYYKTLYSYALLDQNMMDVMAQEHCTILESLVSGDLEAALMHLGAHIREQRQNISEVIALLKISD